MNYTGPANFTAVAECEETTNELGMKLGGLWVVFLIYDVGLSRSKKLPLHCSALCGPSKHHCPSTSGPFPGISISDRVLVCFQSSCWWRWRRRSRS